MRYLTVLAFVVAFLAGCASDQVRGGGLLAQSDGKGGWIINASGNSTLQRGVFKAPDGTAFTIEGYSRDSSTLGAIQGNVAIQQSAHFLAGFQSALSLVGQIAPGIIGGGGSVVIPTTPVDPTAAENTRAAILAKLDACLFIPADRKPQLAAWVKAYPAARIGDLAGFAAGL